MKSNLFKRFITLAVCACMVGGSTFAVSNVYKKTIQVQYSGIKLVVDGVSITPKDANGTVVEPFVYNGTTYLPVRAVGNAIGKQVTWDGNTQTVYLGEVPKSQTYLMTVCPPYDTDYGYYSANGDAKDGTNIFRMAGNTYTHGFKVGFCSETVGTKVLFNLNGLYSTLNFDLGPVEDHNGLPLALKIYLDGNLTDTIFMTGEDLPKNVTLDLHNACQLKIEALSAKGQGMWGTEFGIANAILK